MEQKTKKSTLLGWGVGDFGFQLMILVSVYYFSAFLTDYAQFPVAVAGLIMTLTGVGDAITQPFSGVLVTKANMKWGKYRSWYIVAPPIVALMFILGYTRIGSDLLASIIIIASYVACRFSFNCIWAAHLALIPYVGKTPEERGFLSASRGIWQTAGALIFSAVSVSVLTKLTEKYGRVTGVTVMAAIFSLFMIAGYLVAFFATRDVKEPVEVATKERKKTDAKSFVMAVVKNPPLLWLMLGEVCRNLGSFTFTTMCFYYFKYTTDQFAMYAVFMSVSNFVKLGGAMVTSWLCGKLGAKATYVIGTIGNAVFYLIAFIFHQSVTAFIIFASLGMLLASLPTGATSLLFGQCGQYSQWKTGVDNRAFVTGLIGFPVKIASFTKGLVFTAVMTACGFVANQEASAATQAGIRRGTLIVPAAFFVANVIFGLLCGLDKKTVATMETELAAAEAEK